jgi:hypothetical protein
LSLSRAWVDTEDSRPESAYSGIGAFFDRRKAANAKRDDGSLDRADFGRHILPKLQGLPVRLIAEAMGVSRAA